MFSLWFCSTEIKAEIYLTGQDVLQLLVYETLGMAILDSGCTRIVCGERWLKDFLENKIKRI